MKFVIYIILKFVFTVHRKLEEERGPRPAAQDILRVETFAAAPRLIKQL